MKKSLSALIPKPTLPCFTIPVYVLLPPYNFFADGFMLTGN